MKNWFFGFYILIFLVCSSSITNAAWCRRDLQDSDTEENFRATVARSFVTSDFVFAGTVTSQDQEHITFDVAKSWKGGVKGKITFNLPGYIDSLDYKFSLGKNYLVYGYVTLDGLAASACSGRTNLLVDAQRDINELNRRDSEASGVRELCDFIRPDQSIYSTSSLEPIGF